MEGIFCAQVYSHRRRPQSRLSKCRQCAGHVSAGCDQQAARQPVRTENRCRVDSIFARIAAIAVQ